MVTVFEPSSKLNPWSLTLADHPPVPSERQHPFSSPRGGVFRVSVKHLSRSIVSIDVDVAGLVLIPRGLQWENGEQRSIGFVPNFRNKHPIALSEQPLCASLSYRLRGSSEQFMLTRINHRCTALVKSKPSHTPGQGRGVSPSIFQHQPPFLPTIKRYQHNGNTKMRSRACPSSVLEPFRPSFRCRKHTRHLATMA